jgi:hypothetical protein
MGYPDFVCPSCDGTNIDIIIDTVDNLSSLRCRDCKEESECFYDNNYPYDWLDPRNLSLATFYKRSPKFLNPKEKVLIRIKDGVIKEVAGPFRKQTEIIIINQDCVDPDYICTEMTTTILE